MAKTKLMVAPRRSAAAGAAAGAAATGDGGGGRLWAVVVVMLVAAGVGLAVVLMRAGVRRRCEPFNGNGNGNGGVPAVMEIPIADLTQPKVNTTGEADCRQVTVASYASDGARSHAQSCKEACSKQADYRNFARGAHAYGNNIRCECCDPSSHVTLKSELPGSTSCDANTTFGKVPNGGRAMYTRLGCKGMFEWDDGSLVTCTSDPHHQLQQVCPYHPDLSKLASINSQQSEIRQQLEEQERAEKARRDSALLSMHMRFINDTPLHMSAGRKMDPAVVIQSMM